jgi:hypothetical protein
MQSLKKPTFLCVAAFSAIFLGGAAAVHAEDRWVDPFPALQVGCLRGMGDLKDSDFVKQLGDNAKKAGATAIGSPFLANYATAQEDGKTVVRWEACVVYRGSLTSTAGFETKNLAAGIGAFEACQGEDSKACADLLLAWIKGRIPDFTAPVRVIPLVEFTTAANIRASEARLLADTPTNFGASGSTELPAPADALEQQLFGDSKAPRPLLSASAEATAPPKGGRQQLRGVLVFVPISEAQKALLDAAN